MLIQNILNGSCFHRQEYWRCIKLSKIGFQEFVFLFSYRQKVHS